MEDDVDDFLAHYGVKGMKWGQRKTSTGVPRKTERTASKDAKEFARAKMFYGEGAGIRRRQINATVKSRSKDPAYKEAFDRNLEGQNMAKRAVEARSARKRKDVSNSTKKTAKGISHVLKGNSQYANVAATLIVGGATYAHAKGFDKTIIDAGKRSYSDALRSPAAASAKAAFSNWRK